MRVCGLDMSQRELYKPEGSFFHKEMQWIKFPSFPYKPQFLDVIGLKKTLQELKQNCNKTRIVSFTGLIDNSINKVGLAVDFQCESFFE